MFRERIKFFLILLSAIFKTKAYIFDVRYSYLHPTNGTQYTTVFLQQDQIGFRFIAGAPKDDQIALCGPKLCREFHLNVKNPAGFEMLGGSIGGGDMVGDPTYVCAPRHIATQQYRVNGRCFALHSNFIQITPLDNVYSQVQIFNNTYEFLYAHGESGFSVKHVDKNEFLLGAPGVLSWKGTVIKHTSLDSKDILQPEKKINRNSYLGYAIEFGSFYFSGRKKSCVIAGAPRGDNLLGQLSGDLSIIFSTISQAPGHPLQVYIFDYESIKDLPLRILKGDQISSYYGSALLATKDHLFIGAPMYNMKTYEEGCVFIYQHNVDDLVFWEKICGHHRGGRFGTALTNIGILDANRNIGVAISAPYADNGGGIVYIYVQNENGFKEIQQIFGKTVTHNIAGFGINLSNGLDIDRNAYNDFAVGSLISDVLIILRSRKILRIEHNINNYVKRIGSNSKNLIIGYCYTYTGRKGANDTLTAKVLIESDGRVLISNSSTTLESKIGDTKCLNFLLTLKPHAFDSPAPLRLKISNKLAECPECPVVYPKTPDLTHKIPFVTGCGNEDTCVPNITLQAKFENITELVIGSRDAISLNVSVSNLGETAFVCKMNVTIPIEIRQFPPACSKVENMLHCDISNRLLLNQQKQLEFQFDVKRLNPRLKEITVNISVSSAGSGNGSNAQLSLTLPVRLKSKLSLIGFSNPEYIENRESLNFTHEYVLFNSGPSPLLDERIEFTIPENLINMDGGRINTFIISPLADECIPFDERPTRNVRDLSNLQQMLKDVPQHIKYSIGCQNVSVISCKSYHCSIGELNANSSMKFKFRLEVMTSVLIDTLGEQVQKKSLFLIESTAKAINGAQRNEILVRTVLFRKIVEVIDWWMWIGISVVGSIVILVIIVFILYKLNFFARPMREKLLSEEENKHERECIVVNDDISAEEPTNSEEGFNDIRF